jgi:hypothetical protein
MAGDMSRSLADGQLCFAQQFITQRKQPEILREFCEQLTHYREDLIQPVDEATGKWKKIVTGKSTGRKDDLCICAQIALYYSGKKRMESAFRDLAEQRGWRY